MIGIALAVLFAASNAYTALASGMTVAAGIPGAILGAGLLAILSEAPRGKPRGIFSAA